MPVPPTPVRKCTMHAPHHQRHASAWACGRGQGCAVPELHTSRAMHRPSTPPTARPARPALFVSLPPRASPSLASVSGVCEWHRASRGAGAPRRSPHTSPLTRADCISTHAQIASPLLFTCGANRRARRRARCGSASCPCSWPPPPSPRPSSRRVSCARAPASSSCSTRRRSST